MFCSRFNKRALPLAMMASFILLLSNPCMGAMWSQPNENEGKDFEEKLLVYNAPSPSAGKSPGAA